MDTIPLHNSGWTGPENKGRRRRGVRSVFWITWKGLVGMSLLNKAFDILRSRLQMLEPFGVDHSVNGNPVNVNGLFLLPDAVLCFVLV